MTMLEFHEKPPRPPVFRLVQWRGDNFGEMYRAIQFATPQMSPTAGRLEFWCDAQGRRVEIDTGDWILATDDHTFEPVSAEEHAARFYPAPPA